MSDTESLNVRPTAQGIVIRPAGLAFINNPDARWCVSVRTLSAAGATVLNLVTGVRDGLKPLPADTTKLLTAAATVLPSYPFCGELTSCQMS